MSKTLVLLPPTKVGGLLFSFSSMLEMSRIWTLILEHTQELMFLMKDIARQCPLSKDRGLFSQHINLHISRPQELIFLKDYEREIFFTIDKKTLLMKDLNMDFI